MIPFTFTDDIITAFLEGKPYTVDQSHPNFTKILKALHDGADASTISDLCSVTNAIRKTLSETNGTSNVVVTDDAVLYKGTAVHGHLVDRMLQLVQNKLDVTPWCNFLDKLMNNPSKTAVDELYLWLEKSQMPITADGDFLAYKKVQDDFTSYHKNKDGTECHNKIGTWVEMPRNQVDDRRDVTCSTGLHFCSYSYLPSYYGNQGRVVVVKVNPADVVSIPSDYDNAKGRAKGYFVLQEVPEKDVAHLFDNKPVVETPEAKQGDYAAWLEAVACGDTTEGYAEWSYNNGLTLDDWKDAVEAGDTELGFGEWVKANS